MKITIELENDTMDLVKVFGEKRSLTTVDAAARLVKCGLGRMAAVARDSDKRKASQPKKARVAKPKVEKPKATKTKAEKPKAKAEPKAPKAKPAQVTKAKETKATGAKAKAAPTKAASKPEGKLLKMPAKPTALGGPPKKFTAEQIEASKARAATKQAERAQELADAAQTA